jgi:hypothetical protein
MFKTFRDFVERACSYYHIPNRDWTARFIKEQLRKKKLNPTAVVCYINWADGDCLSSNEIGKELGITGRAVRKQLQRLAHVWPHLFRFGPKPPRFDQHKERISLLGDHVI